ncbi:discoidin domain-containing protein [Cohnella nanjingensis]|uniref:Discoidin domain-containing protein n=1 Tax=Cohnella nanjingensis TaxID=1387779 RepID=A0A7X0RZE1_9BACL|nr:discoidin domain-containing protein [Cohnella nanjingensis]MBB6674869.1 discoidin domain-containing protein [Cohnella nanjingensis]
MANVKLRNNKWLWIGLAAVVVIVGAAAIAYPSVVSGNQAGLKKKGELLVVSNGRYEAAFRADNGGIAYLRDKQAKAELSAGNRDGALWWAFLDDDSAMNGAKADAFAYEWNKRKGELSLHYGGPLKVDATVRFEDAGRISLRAEVANGTGKTLKSFRFPYELKVPADQVKDGLLPMLPGARLKDAFFKNNASFEDQYPGVMFASYTALRTTNGSLAVYDVHGKTVATTNLGFKAQVKEPGMTAIVHDYATAVPKDAKWRTPEIVLEIGGDYPDSIASYGDRNGMADYKTLEKKLGKSLSDYARLPFYKMDVSALKDASWDALKTKYADQLAYPGVLHLVGFQTGGHDENYPDFMPPDPKWGGDNAFQTFVKEAKAKGHKLVPYTNFSWWGVHSPTLASLPSGIKPEDLIVQDRTGTIVKEDYGEHSGYVVNINHPYALERIAKEHGKLMDAGFDGIFEDQWGIRNAPFVYNAGNPAGTDPSSAYLAGVRDYFASVKNPMYTEDGFDVLADDATGFMGSNYLWDLLGYRAKTAAYTDYYPMIGMLVRDKVMLYQHDLAAETMTDSQDMLRWNAAMGYNLSADLFNGVNNPWVELAGVFQRYVLADYVDKPVLAYAQVTDAVTRTDFGSRQVTANWDKKQPYALDAATALSPGGFDIVSKDGKVRAGNYVRYNGADLDPGEHDLVEVRADGEIRVYQPYGTDTTLRIKKGAKWSHAKAAAYTAGGAKIADLPVVEDGEALQFDYVALIKTQKVGYVALTKSDKPSEAKETFAKVKLQTNLAAGKDILSTTDTAKEFPAKLANDGDPYTYWESVAKKFPQSITVDLGETHEVQRIVLSLPPQDAWEKRDQQIEVLGSEDGQTFATLSPSAPRTFDPKAGNQAEIQLDAPAKVRYVRLTVSGNTAWAAAQISEFEVYGK